MIDDSAQDSGIADCRWDPFYRRWVIISRKRAFRPHANDIIPTSRQSTQVCPFCPGNENETPPTKYIDRDATQSEAWRVRVVDNKFGAVQRDPVAAEESRITVPPGSRRLPASGVHEIIIETPIHDLHPAEYSEEEMVAVLMAYRNRLAAAWAEPGIAYATIFKNHGREAGASIEHGHSQLIALPFIPPSSLRPAKECLLCSVVRAESEGVRKIALRDGVFIWSPYPSAFPFETWVAPTSHASDFITLDDLSIFKIAVMVRDLWRALVQSVGKGAAYNLLLHAVPRHIDELNHPWRIELVPRTSRIAGFELGTGSMINPMPPELAAAELRHRMEEMGYAE